MPAAINARWNDVSGTAPSNALAVQGPWTATGCWTTCTCCLTSTGACAGASWMPTTMTGRSVGKQHPWRRKRTFPWTRPFATCSRMPSNAAAAAMALSTILAATICALTTASGTATFRCATNALVAGGGRMIEALGRAGMGCTGHSRCFTWQHHSCSSSSHY